MLFVKFRGETQNLSELNRNVARVNTFYPYVKAYLLALTIRSSFIFLMNSEYFIKLHFLVFSKFSRSWTNFYSVSFRKDKRETLKRHIYTLSRIAVWIECFIIILILYLYIESNIYKVYQNSYEEIIYLFTWPSWKVVYYFHPFFLYFAWNVVISFKMV